MKIGKYVRSLKDNIVNAKGNLRFKFVMNFFLTMLLSGTLAVLVVVLFIGFGISGTLLESQEKAAQTVRELVKEDVNSHTINEIIEMSTIGLYSIKEVSGNDERVINNLEQLNNNEVVAVKYPSIPLAGTLFKINDSYYEISVFPNSTMMVLIMIVIVFAVASVIAIGTILSSYVGKRFLRPIRALAEATESVSNGDFSVEVKMPTNRELRELVGNFNHMTKSLGSIDTLRKDFINSVSHEFKTPIASIRGFATLLRDDKLSEEEKEEYLDIIESESQRLSVLSSNILSISRLENQTALTDCADFSLDEQLRRVILTLEPQWNAKAIEMDIELSHITVFGSEELLWQVWMNIIGNAVKFTPDNGKISVYLTMESDEAVVRIADSGIGMNEEQKKRIFEKFYQCDKSHSGHGNGLGLPLAKRIIDLSGGRIEVDSKPDNGSVFTVYVPNAQETKK